MGELIYLSPKKKGRNKGYQELNEILRAANRVVKGTMGYSEFVELMKKYDSPKDEYLRSV